MTFSIDEKCRTSITGNASTTVILECQTCLENFLEGVSCEINTVVVDELDELFDLHQDHAAFVASSKHVSLQEILEDELMVAIPMVPKHRKSCPRQESKSVENVDSNDRLSIDAYKNTYRPFSDLALKFKRLEREEV